MQANFFLLCFSFSRCYPSIYQIQNVVSSITKFIIVLVLHRDIFIEFIILEFDRFLYELFLFSFVLFSDFIDILYCVLFSPFFYWNCIFKFVRVCSDEFYMFLYLRYVFSLIFNSHLFDCSYLSIDMIFHVDMVLVWGMLVECVDSCRNK